MLCILKYHKNNILMYYNNNYTKNTLCTNFKHYTLPTLYLPSLYGIKYI